MKIETPPSPNPYQATSVSFPFDYMKNLTPHEALCAAIRKNDLSAVSYVVDHAKIDFSAIGREGQNPIHLAVSRTCRDSLIDLLIERSCASGNAAHEADRYGYTPFMIAVELGNIKIARSLINMGATVCTDNDANCSAHQLAAKQQTISHARILLEARGDIPTAHTLALQRGEDSFETIFSRVHEFQKQACAQGDIRTAKALIEYGADPSFVLMQTLHESSKHWAVSPNRATIIRNLLVAGADPYAALRYSLLSQHIRRSTMERLLMSGASGEKAITVARQVNRTNSVLPLFTSKKNWDSTLIQAAVNGDTNEIRYWLNKTVLSADRVFLDLIGAGNKNAIKLLIAEGLSPRATLTNLTDDENVAATRFLISAGADVSPILSSMLKKGELGLPMGIKQLDTLIQAGVDVSKMLLDATQTPRDLTVAKVLIAAGASISDALKQVSGHERAEAANALDAAARDVRRVAMTLRNTRHADSTLIEAILVAEGMRDRGRMDGTNQPLTELANHFQAKGENAKADLVRAIEKVDWKSITSLVDRHEDDASDVLKRLLHVNAGPSARLLVHANVTPSAFLRPSSEFTDSQIKDYDVLLCCLLINAGQSDHGVLERSLDERGPYYTKKIMDRAQIDLNDMFKHMLKSGNESALQKFIPGLTSGAFELATACSRGDTALAQALIAAGANAGDALYIAMVRVDIDATDKLIELGADKSVALAAALSENSPLIAETLITLGADPVVALTHVPPEHLRTAKNLLVR